MIALTLCSTAIGIIDIIALSASTNFNGIIESVQWEKE
jgi:hypothetical protein